MIKYKPNIYIPPSFRYFTDWGKGLLWLAGTAMEDTSSSLSLAMQDLKKSRKKEALEAEDTFMEAYAALEETATLLMHLDYMSKENRDRHLKLNPEYTLDEVREKHAEHNATMMRLEAEFPEWLTLLDDSLLYAIEYFQNSLAELKQNDTEAHFEWEGEGYHEPMESIGDICGYRDDLEYARLGIEALQTEGRLKDLKSLGEFLARLKTTDERLFKPWLGEKRNTRFWTDPTFWWNEHPDCPEQDAMFVDPPKRSGGQRKAAEPPLRSSGQR